MKIIEPGHIYKLHWLDGVPPLMGDDQKFSASDLLVFVNREDHPHPGTQTQEVLRALIDRTRHCDNCLRWASNDEIIHHLQAALVLHEERALMRRLEKGRYNPELISTGEDGHFVLHETLLDPLAAPHHTRIIPQK